MTRTKKSALLVSVLAIVLCAAVIAGATFALFTDKSDLNIAVTSGDLDVTAQITSTATYSMGEKQEGGAFENGGKLTVDGGKVSLDRMTPGDKAVIELKIENNSDIAVKQRFIMSAGSASDPALLDQMLFGVSGKNPESYEAASFTYYSNFTSSWEEGSADGETRYITVELPEYAGSAAQGKACSFDLAVEVVQGNADVANDASASKVYLAEDQDALTQALADAKDGETVVLYGSASTWNTAEIAFEGEKTVTVCGYDVGTLTVNARGGTINYYINYTERIDKAIVADNSLHIYGKVGAAQVNVGRVVVEAGAKVESLAAIPSENSSVKVDIAENAAVDAVAVDASAENSSTNLTVAENVVLPSLSVEGTGEVVIENKGEIEDTSFGDGAAVNGKVTDEQTLRSALQMNGATVVLENDITVQDTLTVTNDITLDLNGYTLSNAGEFFALSVSGKEATLTLKDSSSEQTGAVYGGKGGSNQAVRVTGGAIVDIYGGNYSVGPDANNEGNSCIEVAGLGGTVNIYGGTFSSEAAYKGFYYVLNTTQTQGTTGAIFVYGGKFLNFDPAKGDDSSTGNGGSNTSVQSSYLAEGYTSVQTGDYYTVIKGEGVFVPATDDAQANGAALTQAVASAKAGSSVLLESGEYALSSTLVIDKDITLLGNGATLSGAANLIQVNYGSNAVVKDIVFTATAKAQAVVVSGSATVEGCSTTSSKINHLVYVNGSAASVNIINCTSSRPLANIEEKSDDCAVLIEGCTFKGSFDVCAVTCTSKLVNITFRNNTGSVFGYLIKTYNNMLTTISNAVFEGNENIKLFYSPNETVKGYIDAAISSGDLQGVVKNENGVYVQA